MIYPKNLKDFQKACREVLEKNKIRYQATIAQNKYKDIPTLIISNHYVRPILSRKSMFTTTDSIITSSIITSVACKLLNKKINWAVKATLTNNFLIFKIKSRSFQNNAIKSYNLIPIYENYPFGSGKEILENLRKESIITLYPEGKTSCSLKKPNDNFNQMLSYLVSNLKEIQIVPVSIYDCNGVYQVKFTTAVYLNEKNISSKTSEIIMRKIALGLPLKLRGDYKD